MLRWKFLARVTNKTELKSYPRCKLFTFDLLDGSSEIKCTAFDSVAVKFFDVIEVILSY